MVNSRQKGKRGELELSAFLRTLGFSESRRGQQYSGIGGADVVGIDGVHIECKRVNRLNIHEAMEQAIRDANGKVPSVAHRRDRTDWLLTIRLDDLRAFADIISQHGG